MKEYFSHDYNARNDQKIVKLCMDFGLSGLGIYWCLIEILYECEGYIKEDQLSTIAYELRTECERIESILNTDLFQKKGKKFYSDSVLKRLDVRKEKSDKARQSALSRWNPKDKPDANALPTDSESNAIKLKKKKLKESKEDITLPFESDYFKNTLDEFVDHRKSIKKKMTDLAIKKMLSRLVKLSDNIEAKAILILDQSIEMGWAGLFELKDDGQNNSNNEQAKPKVRDYNISPEDALAKIKAEQEANGGY